MESEGGNKNLKQTVMKLTDKQKENLAGLAGIILAFSPIWVSYLTRLF